MKFNTTAQHSKNIALAKAGKKAPAPAWKPRRHQVRLEQNEAGQWIVYINGYGQGIIATDVEISLWLDLLELKNALAGDGHD